MNGIGTITLKDGRTMSISEYAGMIEDRPSLVYREEFRKEEKKYSGCLKKYVDGVWRRPKDGVVREMAYNEYTIKTENLRRRGVGNMDEKIFNTKVFKLFEALFKNQGVWLNSRLLGEMTGTKINSVSVLMKRTVAFLIGEGLLKTKQDPEHGRVYMFVGQCEKPEEEARIWYGKMRERKSKKTGTKPPEPVITASPPVLSKVLIDTQTMEAVIRVPLDKLAAVFKAIS